MMVRANYLNLDKMDFRASPFGFLSNFGIRPSVFTRAHLSIYDIPILFAQTRTSVSHSRRETVVPPNPLAAHRVQAPP
jgi:hypothetical protein